MHGHLHKHCLFWAVLRAHGLGGRLQRPHQGVELPGKRDSDIPSTFPWTIRKGSFCIKMVIRWKLLAQVSVSLIQQDHFHLFIVVIMGSHREFSCSMEEEPLYWIKNTCSSWWWMENWGYLAYIEDPKHWQKWLAQNKVTSGIVPTNHCTEQQGKGTVCLDHISVDWGPFPLWIWPSNCVLNSLSWAREEETLFLTLSQLLFSVTLV